MNTLDTLKYQTRVKRSLTDSRESFFSKPLIDFFSQETPFCKARFHEEENSFHWLVEIPGITKENLTIRIDGHSMLVSVKEMKSGDVRFTRTLFHHTFRIPSAADVTKVVATCRNSVLKISIAKLKAKRIHRMIPVHGEEDNLLLTPVTSLYNSVKETVHRVRESIANAWANNKLKAGGDKFSYRTSA